MITFYKCEKCGQVYDSWDKCFYHEQDHIVPEAYAVKAGTYLPDDYPTDEILCADPRPYPLDINVPMTDGALVQYTFNRVIAPALETSLEAAANE